MNAERNGSAPPAAAIAAPSRLLSAEETAERLAVPKSWVYAGARAGRIPHLRLGRYVRFRPETVAAWVCGLERGPVPERDTGSATSPDPNDEQRRSDGSQ